MATKIKDGEAEEAINPKEAIGFAEHGEVEQLVGAADGENLLRRFRHDNEEDRCASMRKGRTMPP